MGPKSPADAGPWAAVRPAPTRPRSPGPGEGPPLRGQLGALSFRRPNGPTKAGRSLHPLPRAGAGRARTEGRRLPQENTDLRREEMCVSGHLRGKPDGLCGVGGRGEGRVCWGPAGSAGRGGRLGVRPRGRPRQGGGPRKAGREGPRGAGGRRRDEVGSGLEAGGRLDPGAQLEGSPLRWFGRLQHQAPPCGEEETRLEGEAGSGWARGTWVGPWLPGTR